FSYPVACTTASINCPCTKSFPVVARASRTANHRGVLLRQLRLPIQTRLQLYQVQQYNYVIATPTTCHLLTLLLLPFCPEPSTKAWFAAGLLLGEGDTAPKAVSASPKLCRLIPNPSHVSHVEPIYTSYGIAV
ncbi:unnamed protein product, partial [Laminaria digitata]